MQVLLSGRTGWKRRVVTVQTAFVHRVSVYSNNSNQQEMQMKEYTKKEEIEARILELPIVQYLWINTEELDFSERVRTICQQECPRYGTSWACPPGVGTVEECKKRCMAFDGAFVFTTIAEVTDVTNMEETLSTRSGHEEVTHQIAGILREYYRDTLALSGDSCAICEKCAYPQENCRHPERMIPCVEGYGIVVPLLAEKVGIEFMNGNNIVTWFGLVLFTE